MVRMQGSQLHAELPPYPVTPDRSSARTPQVLQGSMHCAENPRLRWKLA